MPQTSVLAGVAAPAWKSGAVSENGVLRKYRVNTALRHASDTSLYPFRLEVVVPLAEPGWAGQPTAAETQRLAGIEDRILAAVAGRAVLAAVATAAGGRWFIFYTETAEWTAELSRPLQQAADDDAVSVFCDPDADWQTYRRLLKDGRRKITGLAVLGAVPLLCAGMILVTYGLAWALGELGVLLALGAAGLLTRKRAKWFLSHAVLMFGVYTVLLAALLFALVALLGHGLGLAAWAALTISVLAGAVLTGSVWKAQQRYLREQQVPDGSAPADPLSPAAS